MNIIRWTEYNQSELPAIKLLQELGYTYIESRILNPSYNNSERSSMRVVLLSKCFTQKIKDFNPWISDLNIKNLIRTLTIPTVPNEIEVNEQIWRFLTKKGELVVKQDIGDGKGARNQKVKIIDWKNPEKNEFAVTNQFKVNGPKGNRIPDIVIFINGIPIVVIECKSPNLSAPLAKGITQLIEYQDIIPKLFYTTQILISMCSDSAVYGVIGNTHENYQIWKEPYPIKIVELEKIVAKTGRTTPNPTPQDILLYGLLEKSNLLDIIRNFIIFEVSQGKFVKKIARYQQFRATNKTIKSILNKPNKERGGTIWHTQGSGKSLTMLFTAIKLRREKALENPLLVFVCDRIDLVKQLNGTFDRCGFRNPIKAKTADHLKRLIHQGTGNTIFTTIQKFRTKKVDSETRTPKEGEEYEELNSNENIFVLVDEAHRTQYDTFATNMRVGMPNACYIAYTGTPLARNEKKKILNVGRGKTVSKFGPLIDVYDIRTSVEDNSTIKILYTNRLPELCVEGENIDAIFERVFKDKTSEEREHLKKKYVTQNAILIAPERIKKTAWDIIEHYTTHIEPDGFKGQVVVESRRLAVLYKKYLDEYNAPESVVIISENPKYDADLREICPDFIIDKGEQQNYIDRFRDQDDSLKLLIVCDMLITGFDAPIEQVMYLDKSLKEHNLLQAIARVNRLYKNKNYGLIVDYFGVSNHLQEALEIFDTEDIEGFMRSIEDELFPLQQYHKSLLAYFDGVDLNDSEVCLIVLEPEDVRAKFHSDFRKFSTSMDIVMPDPRAAPYLPYLKRFGELLLRAKNRFREEQLNLIGCGPKVQKIIDEYIKSPSVKLLVEPVPILSDKFQEVLENLKYEQSVASEMQHAIQHETMVKLEDDPEFYGSLKEKLKTIIDDYTQRRVTLAEQIKELKALITTIQERPNIARQLGLNNAELAFYNLFKDDLTKVTIQDEREMVKFTYKILEGIEKYITIIDWESKPDTLRKIRKKTKDIIYSEYNGIPIERREILAKRVEELAKVHFSFK